MTYSRETTRLRLLEAAVTQVATEGMRGLTHRKVEARAEVSQGLAKYHFGSLDGLIEQLLRHMMASQFDLIIVQPPHLGLLRNDPAAIAALHNDVRAALARSLADKEMTRARFELYLHSSDKPHLQQIIATARHEFVERVAAVLQVPEPLIAARMLLAMVDGILLDQLSSPDQEFQDAASGYLLALAAASTTMPLSVPAATEDD
ncbi:MAG: TetR family transcriptional regulator [Propionibacteriaceae bacterium]|nr:TetR family transcriptional regulator [Propionibacteriaceae bacterium]